MRSALIPARSFDKESPVTAYWLTRCEGFRVRAGTRRGRVEDVAIDPARGRAAYLVVRSGLRRREVVPTDLVHAVVPAEELIVVRRRRRTARLTPAVRNAGAGAARATQVTAKASARATSVTAQASRRSVTALARASIRAELVALSGTRRGAATTRHETERLGRWLAPRAVGGGRAVARALLLGLLWTALGLAVIVQAVRVYGPPARRAVARRIELALAHARSWLASRGTPGEPQPRRPEQDHAEASPGLAHSRRHAA
jgi:hypothetical protein